MRSRQLLVFAVFALILISLSLSTSPAGASPGWEKVLDRPTPNFGGVDFVSDSEGWMVAGAGLLHTTDGGATWTEAAALTGTDVDFADTRHGWLTGPSGAVYATADGGATWNAQQSGTSVHLTDVFAVSAQEAWAVGRGEGYSDVIFFPKATVLLHTTDGGATWHLIALPPNSEFSEIAAAGSSVWALGTECVTTPEQTYCPGPSRTVLLRTTDGGATWSRVGMDLPGMSRITFVNDTHGWAIGGGGGFCNTPGCAPFSIPLLETHDAGATWATFVESNGSFVDVTFVSDTEGWTLFRQHDGQVLLGHTEDDGGIWNYNLVGRSDYAQRLTMNGSVALVTGYGVALRSTNGGLSWDAVRQPALRFDTIQFLDARTGFAVSGDDLLRTGDGGVNWERAGGLRDAYVRHIDFLDPASGFFAGNECIESSCHPAVYRTSDGGHTWTLAHRTATDGDAVVRLEFIDRQHGWLVTNLLFAVTSDGGTTWEERPLGTMADFTTAADLVDAMHAWAVTQTCTPTRCDYGLIRSDDGTRTWHTVRSLAGTTEFLRFVDADQGWYIGTSCTDTCVSGLFATMDGGASWQHLDANVELGGVTDMVFVDRLNGWISLQRYKDTGPQSDLLHTADGGRTWVSQLSGELLFGDLEFVNVEHGWLALAPYRGQGIGGGPPNRTVLYRTTDAGGGPIGREPEFPKVGGGADVGREALAAPLLLLAAAIVAFATAATLQRRGR